MPAMKYYSLLLSYIIVLSWQPSYCWCFLPLLTVVPPQANPSKFIENNIHHPEIQKIVCQQSLCILQSAAMNTELENEEPLSVMFQRAVVLQRSGSHQQALEEYGFFLKAAAQCQGVEPYMYAEVYGNMGAIFLRQKDWEAAESHLKEALTYRPKFGTAHVNLAVIALQQAAQSSDPVTGMALIQSAKERCEKALDCNTDPRSVAMAKKLLEDIHNMISSTTPFQ